MTYTLFYQPSGDAMKEIISAPSIDELKVAAKEDSKKQERPPERYLYSIKGTFQLFNREEVRQCNIYNSIHLNE